MARRILLVIGLFCYAPLVLGGGVPEKSAATFKAFINPVTGNFDSAPRKNPSYTREITQRNVLAEPVVLDSPVTGGGKMIRVNGLLNSDFVIHKTKQGWQTQCHLLKNP